jgi:hypothetical protein
MAGFAPAIDFAFFQFALVSGTGFIGSEALSRGVTACDAPVVPGRRRPRDHCPSLAQAGLLFCDARERPSFRRAKLHIPAASTAAATTSLDGKAVPGRDSPHEFGAPAGLRANVAR